MAFPSYYSPITVQTGQVPSSQSDFPMLVSYTDNRLKTVANTGHVRNANGYDIRPYSNSTLTTALNFELEYYNASTGQVVMWVSIPSISDGYVIYLSYGEPSITTNGSSTTAWNSAYLAVYHFADGTTLNVNDSTSNAYNLTNNGSWGAGTGQIDGGTAKSDPASSQYFSNTSIASPASITVSYWQKVLTGDHQTDAVFAFSDGSSGFNNSPRLLSHAPYIDDTIYWDYANGDGGDGRVSTSYSSYLDAWTYVSEVYNNSNGLHAIYLNGSSAVSGTHSNSNPSLTGILINKIATSYGKRQLDEFRVSNSARSTNWIATEYNNQSAPSTFAVLGTEVQSDVDFDASSNSGYQAATSSYNWNHTCTGSNRYLVVGISMLSLAQTVSSITYNSVSLSLLGTKNSVSGAARIEMWGLVAPATGTHSIAVTLSGSIASAGNASSYTGVNQSSSTEAFNSAQATNVGAADATVDITTVADNDWVVDTVATDDTAITVGAGQVQTGNVTGAGGSGAMSWEPKGAAGVVTMSWTAVGAVATWTIGGIALRPTSAAGGGGSSPSSSISPSPSSSASSSISKSPSSSVSLSISPSPSSSQSPSSSISSSISSSVSASQSPSSSVSASISLSPSSSQSPSSSVSLSPSSSVSLSPSSSVSASQSPSSSPSSSVSSSVSLSPSASQSPSSSVSSSPSPSVSTGKPIKYWSGSAWIKKPLKVFTAGSFQIKATKYWDGSAWQDVDVNG